MPVLDDAHDDDDETVLLTLSNPTGAVLDGASATGTIDNNDVMPRALMARFGRLAAGHIVDQVEQRVSAPRRPGFDGQLAGRTINRTMGRDFAVGLLRQLAGRNSHGQAAARSRIAGGAGQASFPATAQVAGGLEATPLPMAAGNRGPAGEHHGVGPALGIGHGNLLTGTRFSLTRATTAGATVSFWSRTARSHFHGREGVLSLNGDLQTTMVGADYAKGRLISGLSLAHSRGTGSYTGTHSGAATSTMTGAYPWVGYRVSERTTVCTVAGYGTGGLTLAPGRGSALESPMRMAMAAAGGRARIAGEETGGALAFKTDALWVTTTTGESHGPGGRLNGTTARASRVRAVLEGSSRVSIGTRVVRGAHRRGRPAPRTGETRRREQASTWAAASSSRTPGAA